MVRYSFPASNFHRQLFASLLAHHGFRMSFKLEIAFCVHGVISPLLANVYLHYVFDLWAHQWRRREAKGNVVVVRYADDIVVGFEHEADARLFWDAMRLRFVQFGLELQGEKTRLLEFDRDAAARRKKRGLGKPETFTFLGFTFICGTSRRRAFQLQRHSRRDRMRAKLREVKIACDAACTGRSLTKGAGCGRW
jgi:hypothetical protein